MNNFLVNHFWTYYDGVTERKIFEKYIFLKRRSVPFHTLKRRTTNVKFCVDFLKPKENMFELVGQPCFEFEKLVCFPFYTPRARKIWIWKGNGTFLDDVSVNYLKNQFEEHYLISNDTQFHSTFLTEEAQMSNYV